MATYILQNLSNSFENSLFLCEESKFKIRYTPFIKITVKNTALTIISNPVAPDFEELCLGCFFRYRKHNFLKDKLVKIAHELFFFLSWNWKSYPCSRTRTGSQLKWSYFFSWAVQNAHAHISKAALLWHSDLSCMEKKSKNVCVFHEWKKVF